MDDTLLDFDQNNESLALKQIPVRFKGKHYLLVEALGDAVAQWRNSHISGTKVQQSDSTDQKTISLGNLADSEPLLVSLCLYEADDAGQLRLDVNGNVDTRYRVRLSIIKSWPHRVVSALFEKAKEISGLNDTETVESLEKQIATLQTRLARLKKVNETEEQEALAKN